MKFAAAMIGGSAILAAAAVVTNTDAKPEQNLAGGGSGHSATGTNYVQPSASVMTFAQTTVETTISAVNAAATTLVTSVASPTYKATPPAGFAQ